MNEGEEEYRRRLAEDPGDECFVDYAEYLRLRKQFDDGLLVCVRGLSAKPELNRARLVLARICYDAGYYPFAMREVEELSRALPDNVAVRRLHEVMLADKPVAEVGDAMNEVVAETSFDVEDLEQG